MSAERLDQFSRPSVKPHDLHAGHRADIVVSLEIEWVRHRQFELTVPDRQRQDAVALRDISRQTTQRLGCNSEIRELNEAAGFEVLGHFWTQGQYDLVTIVEAPSEEAMVNGSFNIARSGNVSSETLRAFTDDEMQRIIGPA